MNYLQFSYWEMLSRQYYASLPSLLCFYLFLLWRTSSLFRHNRFCDSAIWNFIIYLINDFSLILYGASEHRRYVNEIVDVFLAKWDLLRTSVINILLQTTRKENNWKTEETLGRAVVTLETERIKGSNPWCLWRWWCWWCL